MANCVYRLLSLDKSIKEFYIGSTANLKERTRLHKSCCNNSNSKGYNYKVYTCIRENGGWDNWKVDIELLTTGMPEKDRKELEQNYIDCLKPQLNSINAIGMDKQEYQKEYQKEYRLDNKEQKKQYYDNNKDKINGRRREKRKQIKLKKTKVI
tara:strand:+ start:122 stop:580 length:459 start_codon:yes stop_codon:yes gene_type:complete